MDIHAPASLDTPSVVRGTDVQLRIIQPGRVVTVSCISVASAGQGSLRLRSFQHGRVPVSVSRGYPVQLPCCWGCIGQAGFFFLVLLARSGRFREQLHVPAGFLNQDLSAHQTEMVLLMIPLTIFVKQSN